MGKKVKSKKPYLLIFGLVTIVIIASIFVNRNFNNDENKKTSSSNEKIYHIKTTNVTPFEPISLKASVLCCLDVLDEVIIQLIPYPDYDANEINYVFYSYSIYNKYGIQIYEDGFLNATQLPLNITIKMPPNPPYLFFTQCRGRINYIANWSKLDFEIGRQIKYIYKNYSIETNNPNSINQISFEFNESTVCWNFIGIDTENSDFFGSFKIIDSTNRIQIMINHSTDGYTLFYNHGARFPVRGKWTATLETFDKGNAIIKFPIIFLYMEKKILESRGFLFKID